MSAAAVFLFSLVVLITHLIEGITGFGCTVLALPFGVYLFGLKTAVPTLVILALILALYVVISSYNYIIWRVYFRILFFMGLGLPVGLFLFSRFPEKNLKLILAVFMIFIGLRGLYMTFSGKQIFTNMPDIFLKILLFLGGCIHGAFGSGGPLAVIYATKTLPEKSNFRATLCLLWVTLNTVILIQDFKSGAITEEVLKLLLFLFPALVLGAFLGNVLHKKMDKSIFDKIVYSVLLLSGVFILF